MSAKRKSQIPADKVALYEKLLAAIPEIERKGADNPFTSLNGNMFSLLLNPEARMALRLPQDERGQFLKKYKTTLFEAYGTDILSFHPSSNVLMAANHRFVRFWDVTTGRLIMKNDQARTPAAFSRDGRLLVTTGTDKNTAILWEVSVR